MKSNLLVVVTLVALSVTTQSSASTNLCGLTRQLTNTAFIKQSQSSGGVEEELLFELPAEYEFVFDRPLLGLTKLDPHWMIFWTSPDRRRVAVLAKRAGGLMVIGNGISSGTYEEIKLGRFSPNSERFVLSVKKGKARLVVNGVEGPEYDEVHSVSFSPDSKRLLYAGKRNNRWRVVEDQRESVDYQEVGWFRFSRDGNHFAFAAKRSDKWTIILDGKEGAEWDEVSSPSFSPDSQRLAYAARRGKDWRMVVDGREGPSFAKVFNFIWSQGGVVGSYLASPHQEPSHPKVEYYTSVGKLNDKLKHPDRSYLLPRERNAFGIPEPTIWWLPVAADTIVGEAAAVMSGPHLSDDGRRRVYVAGDHAMVSVFAEGRKLADITDVAEEKPAELRPLRLINTSTNRAVNRISIVYETWDPFRFRKTFYTRAVVVTLDSTTGTPIQLTTPRYRKESIINPQFGGDGQTFGFELHADQGRVVVNGREGKKYDQILPFSLWLSPDSVNYIARQGRQFYRVKEAY